MELESSPKLDSKTSQKSNSKSKSPKIQRAKNTCDSKKPAKSKNSSKLKSFIRTIPISIALASALSSQAVAGWSVVGGGNVSNVNNVGTITSNITLGDTIIEATANGSYTDIVIGSNVTLTRNDFTASDNNIIRVVEADGGKVTNLGTLRTYSRKRVLHMQGRHMEAFINQGTINNQYWTFYMKSGSSLGSLINEGGTIINSNTGSDGVMIRLENASSIGQITIDGGSIQSGRSFISLANASTIDNITISGNANVENTSSGRTSIDLSGGSVTGTISVEDTASLKSNINISGNNRIGGGIIIGGGSDSPTFSGNITLNNGSILGQGIQVKSGTMTSEVSLNGSSSISKILIDGSNSSGTNGTPKLDGDITLNTSNRITNGITIANGGTYDGTIHNKNSSSIGGIVVDNGTIVGDIIARGTSRLNGITIVNGGEMRGNIEARWMSDSTGHTMNLGNIDIQSRLQGGITLANAATIESLSLSNGGTITNAVSIGAGGSNGHTSILKTITLNGASGINSLVVGSASDNAGTINSITLGGDSSIGNINVAERGTIANLEIGNTNQVGSIGSITNAGKLQNIALNGTSTITNGITNNSGGTISNIALNGTSTITNGITNNSGGTISNITLASSNTINNGITNNSGGNIGTIISDTGTNVNNIITNHGTIGSLEVNNQGTIVYRSDNGIITDVLSVAGGATLDIKDSSGNNTGTIELRSNGATLQDGSELNLDAGSTLVGHLKNSANLAIWTNNSNIQGNFINASGASVGTLTAGNIRDNFLNEGNITNLTIDKNIGTLTNNGSGVINTLIIQDNSNINNGITNNSNIGSLNLQNNTTYSGTGSITNALDIANNKTLTATNNGIKILFANGATGTIDNAGIISGNLNNQNGSTIKTFNTGSISGSIANNATIQELNVTGNVTNGITNNSNIAKLNVNSNVSYSGDNGNISQELVINQGSGQTTTFTIQGTNQTLTLGGTGNGGVKTITNEGTIIGNLINTLSTNWIGGTLEGNFTNNRGATLQSLSNGTITGNLTNNGSIVSLDSGTIGGSLDNQAGGIINTLHSSVVGNLSNAGVVKDFIVDSDMDYTGDGTIANSMTILNNNTLNIGNSPNNGTININFGASATGTIGNAGTINGNITNLAASTIKNFTNESTGKIDGNIINRGIITSFTNFGSFEGNLTNNKTIGNLTTGAITGSIANSGNINTLNVAGNVTNGITNKASSTITTLTINNGASLGSGITNEGNITTLTNNQANTNITNTHNIGTLDINANTTYSGDGNITNEINVESGDTLTIGSGSDTLKFNATNGTINNAGTIKGTIDNIKGSSISVFDNSGSITGIINNGHIVEFTNNASGIIDNFVNNTTISFFENNGVIKDFSGDGIIYGVLNSKEIAGDFINVATSLQNTGTITGDVQLIGNQQNCGNEICKTSDLINEGIIDGTFINEAGKEMNAVKNTGVMGGISNEGNITTINTGSINGSIANSGEITTLNVTGNVNNGITHTAGSITNLTIDKGVILGNNGITNNAAIGNFTNNANITYSGNGSITGNFINASDSTITLNNNNNLILNGNGNAFNNDGTLKGTISNIGALASFTNTGSITGLESGNITGLLSNSHTGIIDNLVVNGNVSQMQNAGNIADAIIKSEITNGIINGDSNYKQATIGKLDIQASLGSNGLQNAGTITSLINNFSNTNLINAGNIGSLDIQKNLNYSGSGSITDSINIASNTTLTTNGITLNANNGNVNNLGTIAGNLTLEGNSNSVTNSGSITTIINNADNSSLTNHSNIGSLAVNENLTYNGNGSITNALEVAKDKTLTIGSNGTLSFNSAKGSVNNAGTIAGNLSNVKDSIITNFNNNGIITGDLYNDGHIDTLSNTGTMGTIYNTSKETIVALGNDKGATIEAVNNTGNINIITNDGTINGQITSQNNSEIKEILIGENGIVNAKGTLDSSNMQDTSNDAVSLDTINTTLIHNQGTIQGNVRVVGQGSVIGEITNQDTISGCILVDGGRIGNINNTNGAIANCMSFSNGASVDNLNNDGTVSGTITNDSGNITVNNSGSGFIGGITTSNGGNTTIINGGMDKPGGNIGAISNTGSNSNTHIDGWTLDNPDNPSNPIIIADGSDKDGIHLKEDSIFVEGNLESGKIYNYYDYIQNEDKESIGQEFSQDDELFNALTFIPIFNPTDNGDGTFSVGLDTQELSGKTLGASLIYSSRMRQINTNSMLREINVKNFKTDFEILEQRERLKNQQALLENYKQQRESYLNELTKDNKELKRVSSKESTSLSTYANNSNIKSDAIEVVDYYNKDTLASLDNLQATTKANQETYSNLDLLRELDDIFISHTGDKDNLYTFALPYTRYTSAQLDGGVGTLKSHASGILAGAQAKLPSERGILGIYFGYESSDKQVGQQRLDFDEKVYYGGLTYYNVFARKGVSEYYLSANTRIDKGDTNLYKTYRSGSTTIDSQVDSYGYGADLKVGANYYNIYNNSVLSPEIGISYQGISTDTFRLRHLGGVSEHYYAQDVNFFDISASLRWQRAWNNVFKTMASLGAMYNVYNDAKGSGVIAGLKQSADINVEELYGTTQVGISYALGENANIALNYSGIFANGVQSHAGYIRLGVWW
ncbi:Uncharacterised protein [Helicobacter pullorum]|uniref:Autotransporter domain-containing protein n=9 Tax=Helicobacter pullorum TaxID=35818 RepID=A0A377PYN3_9HELI|nr:Uncharacterised protein [Helicobacter pullorum]